MPPKKNLHQQLDEHNEAFRETLAEFSDNLWESLRTMEAALRTVLQPQNAAQRVPRREEPIFEDDKEEDVNVFANQFGQHAPPGDHRRWKAGFKLDLPEFSGGIQPEEFLDWINTTEVLLEFKEVPDLMCVPLVATRFHRRASAWWQQLKALRAREAKDRIMS
ncbi:hypothetical protein EUTSA_v10028087mg [Eutrema salsugineum]|uniref:Retrotransposon gag domain-containing protein n=1 Tax=Eutrema salsugineum TaxID=72664 RepID=V4LA00_EUTSA|nr:hypothetical protein EUTSA_v10028087mg [Eutrema salsugineum]